MNQMVFNIKVICTHSPSHKGYSGGFSGPGEPCEPEELLVEKIEDDDGIEIDLSDDSKEKIEIYFLEKIRS